MMPYDSKQVEKTLVNAHVKFNLSSEGGSS